MSASDSLQFLLERSSVPSRQLLDPGPDPAQLQALLEAAIRVPDHGKLVPWRLLVMQDDNLRELGRRLATAATANHPDWPQAKHDKEAQRYATVPLMIAVVSHIDSDERIPAQEQRLSAGCVAHNLLLAAQALGFGAQWLTGWACYDPDAAQVLQLEAGEQVIAFVHIGTPARAIPPRTRPVLADVVRHWTP